MLPANNVASPWCLTFRRFFPALDLKVVSLTKSIRQRLSTTCFSGGFLSTLGSVTRWKKWSTNHENSVNYFFCCLSACVCVHFGPHFERMHRGTKCSQPQCVGLTPITTPFDTQHAGVQRRTRREITWVWGFPVSKLRWKGKICPSRKVWYEAVKIGIYHASDVQAVTDKARSMPSASQMSDRSAWVAFATHQSEQPEERLWFCLTNLAKSPQLRAEGIHVCETELHHCQLNCDNIFSQKFSSWRCDLWSCIHWRGDKEIYICDWVVLIVAGFCLQSSREIIAQMLRAFRSFPSSHNTGSQETSWNHNSFRHDENSTPIAVRTHVAQKCFLFRSANVSLGFPSKLKTFQREWGKSTWNTKGVIQVKNGIVNRLQSNTMAARRKWTSSAKSAGKKQLRSKECNSSTFQMCDLILRWITTFG